MRTYHREWIRWSASQSLLVWWVPWGEYWPSRGCRRCCGPAERGLTAVPGVQPGPPLDGCSPCAERRWHQTECAPLRSSVYPMLAEAVPSPARFRSASVRFGSVGKKFLRKWSNKKIVHNIPGRVSLTENILFFSIFQNDLPSFAAQCFLFSHLQVLSPIVFLSVQIVISGT